MILKLVKQLTPEETSQLLQARHSVDVFNTSVSSDFIVKDLLINKTAISSLLNESDYFSYELLNENIDNSPPIPKAPGYKMSITIKGEVVCELEKDFWKRIKFPNVSLKLYNNRTYSEPFLFFRVYGDEENKFGSYFSWDIMRNTAKLDANMRAFASRFCNRYFLYNEIYRILKKNEEKIKNTIGTEFASDIVSLFSAKEPKSYSFNLPKENIDKELISSFIDGDKLKSREKLLGSMFYSNHGFPLNIFFLMEKDDKLVVFIYISDKKLYKKFPVLMKKSPEKIKDMPELNEKIIPVLNDYLKNYVIYGDFCSQIYEIVKPKLLINNL